MRYYLINIRLKRGFSQRKVAREAGLSYQHYARIENGERGKKVSFLIVGRIAEALGVTLDELFKYEQEYQDSLEFNKEQ